VIHYFVERLIFSATGWYLVFVRHLLLGYYAFCVGGNSVSPGG
jgi:hypothetical protein